MSLLGQQTGGGGPGGPVSDNHVEAHPPHLKGQRGPATRPCPPAVEPPSRAPARASGPEASAADNPQPAGVSGPDTASKGAEDQGSGQEEQDRAEVRRILADKETGPKVREAAQKALAGTAADVRHFLGVELEENRVPDNRLRVVQISDGAGPALRKAADQALRGTAADLLAFLKEGQFTARADGLGWEAGGAAAAVAAGAALVAVSRRSTQS
ncbi:hypothetical protein [Kitasatospora sp. NPDC087314]|uniref:ALF repeat-containing protein n=1 Tax=Kitasatospora sp. NPDC087314 TaxID=3364068 RepID=UPI003809666C